jgi:hypothetical protein
MKARFEAMIEKAAEEDKLPSQQGKILFMEIK